MARHEIAHHAGVTVSKLRDNPVEFLTETLRYGVLVGLTLMVRTAIHDLAVPW